jgi:hypothetical protein
VHTRFLRIRYPGILLGESYTGICTLADFSAVFIYTNRPSGIIAYLVVTLASVDKLSSAAAGDTKLVVMLVISVNKLSSAVVRERLLY